jgi:hypothetical protein
MVLCIVTACTPQWYCMRWRFSTHDTWPAHLCTFLAPGYKTSQTMVVLCVHHFRCTHHLLLRHAPLFDAHVQMQQVITIWIA